MNTLVLVRHGEVEYPFNSEGQRLVYGPQTPLSYEGTIQMEKLVDPLSRDKGKVTHLYTSPYTRAWQSGLPIWRKFRPLTFVKSILKDVYAPGWEGVTMDELKEAGGDIYAIPPRSEDQETLEQLVKRAREALEEMTYDYIDSKIVAVSHGDLLSAMNWVLMREGVPTSYKEMVENRYLEKGEAVRLEVDNELKLRGEGVSIAPERTLLTRENFRGGSSERK